MLISEPARPYKTFGKRRSLRLPEFDYRQSHACHLTWGTYQRRRLLAAPAFATGLVVLLKEEAARARISLLAYCFMPDHVHLLACPESGADLIGFVRGFKSKATRSFWAAGGTGKLWQRGFYDHILRAADDIEHAARYILGNPVRAGLVATITQYPFSGSPLLDDNDNP